MTAKLTRFDSRDLASEHTANLLAAALQQELKGHATASLVVSGGSTPQACFQHLAQIPLPWDKVLVTLTDERCVHAQHPDSNERMLHENLLTGYAAKARFVPLQEISGLEEWSASFTAVLLGMGADGHFASLFPDAANLSHGLDLANPQTTINIHTKASPHPRLSMTLARLLKTKQLLLLAFGKEKQTILQEPTAYPVDRLLQQQSRHPSMQILWAE